MRASCDLFIHVDVAAAMAGTSPLRRSALTLAAGVAFFVSSNGVVLTKGVDGSLSPRFFARVVDRAGNTVEAPAV